MRAWLFGVLIACSAPAGASKPSESPPPAPSEPHLLNVGERAPEVATGKVTLVLFWSTWSEPSKKMQARIEEIWRARRDNKAFTVKSISVDDEPNDLDRFRTMYGFTFPYEWDREHRLAERYAIPTETVVLVVDRNGIVRHVSIGYRDGYEAKIAAAIDELLAR